MSSQSCVTEDDCSLVEAIKSGDGSAFEQLAERYKSLLLSSARTGNYINHIDDLLQEAYLGFFKAIISFDQNFKVPFSSYAKLCVERQVLTAVKKNQKFNSEDFSFHEASDDGIPLDEAVIDRQSSKDLISLVVTRLSGYERQVLKFYLMDLTYEEISVKLGKDIKSVDNALKRIKQKIVTDLTV